MLNTSHPTPADYARIPLTTQSFCPFLDPEQLCGIQRALGPDMLPTTCATYPRALSTIAGEQEKALNLSCPEAARLTLLDPNLLGPGPWRAPTAVRYAAVRRLPSGSSQLQLPADPRLAVREFALLLLTDRTYPLWQRLYLLGLLARRLQTLSTSTAETTRVAQLLADTARLAAQQHLRQAMDEIPAQPDRQLQLVMELLRLRIAEPPVPTRFLECVQDFELGLRCASAQSEQQILDAYADGHRLFYRPLMDRHPHLLENDLTNQIFKNHYPFGRPSTHPAAQSPANAESEHLALCMHLALTQTLLIGMAAHYREAFSPGHVVKLVQSLARTVEHSRQSLAQIATFVRTHQLNNPRGIALLLRHP